MLLSFNDNTLCFFDFGKSILKFMSREVGNVVSQVQMDRQLPFRSGYNLLNLGNDQIMYFIRQPRSTSPQNAIVMNSRGEILIEKQLPFFFYELRDYIYNIS